ncbi:hypothetical protein K1W54_08500 [Micromonospora sp. CPCC 205371]|nr:hypothetical protein [Micromonospora sp. CPCC 205371]
MFGDRRPEHLDPNQAALRNGLRAKWRQLGHDRELLITECAYEQWHRLLFARFLAENNLLLHPKYKAPVTLIDCEELAAELGEPDAWSVAARFAAEILPGIFRLDDPCVRLRLAPEGRDALEQILDSIPRETFTADDALGWVYQFWQRDKKDEVNASERKIGGADLGPVTQLFTENYMVRFLLENSLGAWWASRHPDSPLVTEFEYLRFDEDRKPAAGPFDGWPDRVANITVMDPCCGSGHFLVEAFSMLWKMRMEEEVIGPTEAQDAVLRDNLFGLELDSRCVQIAMFAVALYAWRAGGAWRLLPVPNIACSGIPVKAPAEEWKALADGNPSLQSAIARLHSLFKDAETLGSLIDPKLSSGVLDFGDIQIAIDDVDWDEFAPVLDRALDAPGLSSDDAILAVNVADIGNCARLLSRNYTLIATNVPFLSRAKQTDTLQRHIDAYLSGGRADLATAMLLRWARAGSLAVVTPQHWQSKLSYRDLRLWLLTNVKYAMFARLGNNVWQTQSGGQPFKVPTVLSIFESRHPEADSTVLAIDLGEGPPSTKAASLRRTLMSRSRQRDQCANVDHRILVVPFEEGLPMLSRYARCYQGTSTGDNVRYCRNFWELPEIDGPWRRWQSSVTEQVEFGGRDQVVLWAGAQGVEQTGAAVRGRRAWGRKGVAVSQMGLLYSTRYLGDFYDNNVAALIPNTEEDLPAIRAFASSREFHQLVRSVDQSVQVQVATLTQIPFDHERWTKVADQAGPLAEPWSNDSTQWLFGGRPEISTAPLQVAVGRLVGYRWPEQTEADSLDLFVDADGIVCLPSVAGEAPAADRVLQVVATAFGEEWSPARVEQFLNRAGSKKKNLADWLRDEFFKQHCALFGNRPFVWHIWDGQRDGFSAMVNYHRLDRSALEKLTYTYLGQDWVERQRAGVRDEVAGAETRLSAALGLQRKLEAILAGEAPYDIYVRWKQVHEQPIGWEPDLNDGVRLNIRPFVEAGVLRAPFNIHWRKDRGKNPDGSERDNSIHLTLAKKLEARQRAGRI